MDATIDLDLKETGQTLELDRISIIKLKYNQFMGINVKTKTIPQASMENIFDWQSQLDKHKSNHSSILVGQLSDSYLITQAWKLAPELIKIEGKKQLNKWKLSKDLLQIFNSNLIESLLVIPLFIQREHQKFNPLILGFLILQSYQFRTWKNSEILAGKWIAKQVATSIINQQTLEKVQSLVDERTAQLKVSLEVQAKLSQKMRHHIEELKQLNTIKDEFISSLSDALKTPLSNMKTGIKMLKLINKEEKNLKYLDILEDECEKEINLVNNLLTLEQIQANQLTVEPEKIDLKPLIDNLYHEFSQSLHYQNIQLKIDYNIGYIYTDLNSITLIIKELINNASKFSAQETEINLQIYTELKKNVIKIDNCGLVIEEEEKESIFQPFYQGKYVENTTNSGTGLGLALVKSLVENLNGTIDVNSIPCGKNANYANYHNTFTLKFPQLPNLIDETE